MDSKRLFQILVASLFLLGVASVASAYFGQQMLAEKNTRLDTLKAESAAREQEERSLVQAKKEIEEYAPLESVAKSIVPQEKDQVRTIRELVAVAQQSGIKISSITFPTSDLGDEKAGGKQSQLEKVEGIPGLMQLELNVTIDDLINFPTLIQFLEKLEQNRRTSAISSILISPSEEAGTGQILLRVNLTIVVYIKP